jgi:pseudouridine-5'-monophosphatase
MDGLLLDSEDKYTLCTNAILSKYNKPPLPWSIKAQLQGRPGPMAGLIFHQWAQLPISHEEFLIEQTALQRQHFPWTKPLPGVEKLLENLAGAKTGNGDRVHIALATSSHEANFKLKTGHLEELFAVFEGHRRVLGDDVRIPKGRGKPAPDIYLLALKTINASLPEGEREITPQECLVFEDSVPGVEAGRRAGMRVVWVPHPELHIEYSGRVKEVLAGRTGEAGDIDLHQLGEIDDGWADYLRTLEDFPYGKFGIVV